MGWGIMRILCNYILSISIMHNIMNISTRIVLHFHCLLLCGLVAYWSNVLGVVPKLRYKFRMVPGHSKRSQCAYYLYESVKRVNATFIPAKKWLQRICLWVWMTQWLYIPIHHCKAHKSAMPCWVWKYKILLLMYMMTQCLLPESL